MSGKPQIGPTVVQGIPIDVIHFTVSTTRWNPQEESVQQNQHRLPLHPFAGVRIAMSRVQ